MHIISRRIKINLSKLHRLKIHCFHEVNIAQLIRFLVVEPAHLVLVFTTNYYFSGIQRSLVFLKKKTLFPLVYNLTKYLLSNTMHVPTWTGTHQLGQWKRKKKNKETLNLDPACMYFLMIHARPCLRRPCISRSFTANSSTARSLEQSCIEIPGPIYLLYLALIQRLGPPLTTRHIRQPAGRSATSDGWSVQPKWANEHRSSNV